jgi:hypothetical protein
MTQEIDESDHDISLSTRMYSSLSAQQQPTPYNSIYHLNKTVLVVLLVIFSIISVALNPLIKAGIKRAVEIYLAIPPNTADYYQLQRRGLELDPQTQHTPTPLLALNATVNTDHNKQICRHSYQTCILNRDPLVINLEKFLQPGEADHMIKIAKLRMERSRLVGDKIYSDYRTSNSAYLNQSEDDVIRCIEECASRITDIPIESTEALQVVWYTKGQEFRPHVDFSRLKTLSI